MPDLGQQFEKFAGATVRWLGLGNPHGGDDAAGLRLAEALRAGRLPGVAIAFALFLVGFGIKLGVWPFGQIWLPDAHPAAPSPVSALLSGVMIKTGIYGLMRYFIWLIPGTAQALRQEQSKRLLA